MPELKPCPFCGSTNIKVTMDGCIYQVMCDDCMVESPARDESKGNAIAAWNRRDDGWISVKDKMPEVEQTVLCYLKDGTYNVLTLSWSGTWDRVEGSGIRHWYGHDCVTHWHPLPAPPEVPQDDI